MGRPADLKDGYQFLFQIATPGGSAVNSRQAVLLTGGASLRMNADKAAIEVNGVPMGLRIARELAEGNWPVLVLGNQPLEGFPFQADTEPHKGPVAALRGFSPQAQTVFIVSCDIPLFRGRVAEALAQSTLDADAAVPEIEGRPQYLCAAYRSTCFKLLHSDPQIQRMKEWLALLRVRSIDEAQLRELGIDPDWTRGANTPEQLSALLAKADATRDLG